jgi:dTMP kinase
MEPIAHGARMFFSFDGIDGVGKSTQMESFCQWLGQLGFSPVTCRDPGSTRLGESLRKIVLDPNAPPMGPRSETMLYMAARAQMVEELIRPTLEQGGLVVSDRFLLANVVYQGHAGGLHVPTLWEIGQFAVGGCEPNLIFLLDLDVEQAMVRRGRSADRMEARGVGYLEKVRAGFLAEARRRPDQIVVIDASGSAADVQQQIRQIAHPWVRQAASVSENHRAPPPDEE